VAVRNTHWYNANEGRAYPLDDKASCVSDAGLRLPPDIISDLNLRWPVLLGRYAFVTALANTPNLVTLTIQTADAITATEGFSPLVVLSVRKPVEIGRMYALKTQVNGAGGWVVFGNGVTGTTYRGLFSTPQQTLITPRAGRAYASLPVTSLQALNADVKLTGVVTLKATNPLTLTKEERFISGANRDCIVVRLTDDSIVSNFLVPADASTISGFKQKSAFETFAGPCAGRPESNTCGCPEPIQFVNAVAPDCDGKLTIEFQGCAQLASVTDGSGVAISCEFGLVDACLPSRLPSSAGLLPNEYEPANIPIPDDIPPDPVEPGVSDSFVDSGELPYVECFVGGISSLVDTLGLWGFSLDGSPTTICAPQESLVPVSDSLSMSLSLSHGISPDGSWETLRTATRSISLFDVDISSVYRVAVTEVKLLAGTLGVKHNAQLLINYRPHASVAGQFVYFAAELDYDTQEFRLVRFNGVSFSTIAPASVVMPGIQLDKWYRITATCLPSGDTGAVTITIRLESITDSGIIDVTLAATVNNYQPSNGKFGIGTNRALARFAYLTIDEAS